MTGSERCPVLVWMLMGYPPFCLRQKAARLVHAGWQAGWFANDVNDSPFRPISTARSRFAEMFAYSMQWQFAAGSWHTVPFHELSCHGTRNDRWRWRICIDPRSGEMSELAAGRSD